MTKQTANILSSRDAAFYFIYFQEQGCFSIEQEVLSTNISFSTRSSKNLQKSCTIYNLHTDYKHALTGDSKVLEPPATRNVLDS